MISSTDGNKTKASGNGSSNGVYEGTSVSQSKSDPRISELREKHEQMESKINELRELSRKRDAELQTIKETIRDCKDKVACLRQSFGEDNGRTFGVSRKQYSKGEVYELFNTFVIRELTRVKIYLSTSYISGP